jgi:hypothetical protein
MRKLVPFVLLLLGSLTMANSQAITFGDTKVEPLSVHPVGSSLSLASVSPANALQLSGNVLQTASVSPTGAKTMTSSPVETLAGASNSPDITAPSVRATKTTGNTAAIGDTTIEPISRDNSNFVVVQGPYAAPKTGPLTDMCMYIYAPAGRIALGTYDATGPNGTAGALVGRTPRFKPILGWNCQPIPNGGTMTQGANYYPGYIELNNGNKVARQFASGKEYWAGTYRDLQNPFPTTGNTGSQTGTYSLCANCSGLVHNPPPPPVTACAANPVTTQAGNQQMAILSPCSSNVAYLNQITTPALIAFSIDDATANVNAGLVPISVQAQGMGDVEIWTHGSPALTLTPGANGMFSGMLDLSKEPTGPIKLHYVAYDTTSATGATVELKAEEILFVNGISASPPVPAIAASSGMTLAWSDGPENPHPWTMIDCHPGGIGTWPKCRAPTAADGATWWTGRSGFGSAAFMPVNQAGFYNPFLVKSGFLRIRSMFDPNGTDPFGYRRHWFSGILASSFSDGTSNIPALMDGYYEVTAMVPTADTYPNSNTAGGTWAAPLWMVGIRTNRASGAIEQDVQEKYGAFPYSFQSGIIAYTPAHSSTCAAYATTGGCNGGYIYQASPPWNNGAIGDLTFDFHRYGMLTCHTVTPTCPIAGVTSYLDDVALGTKPSLVYADGSQRPWQLLIDLAMGSGWPINAAPGPYDMWVERVQAWQ